MNQAILFPDIQSWDSKERGIRFPAQSGGALIECFISEEKLKQLSGAEIVDDGDALELFARYRFDIEEIAEEMIEDELFDALDRIVIS